MKNSREIIIKRVHSGTQTHNSQLWDLISTLPGQTLHEETADDNLELHPRATQVLYNDFSVDLLSGASTLEEAMHLQREISTLP
jgi:hypothetical protein